MKLFTFKIHEQAKYARVYARIQKQAFPAESNVCE